MKTTVKTYLIICPSCNGRGYVPNPEHNLNSWTTSALNIPCPACNGSKTITVTETTFEP